MNVIVQTAIELGLLYSFVSLALFISYRVLDIADLTTDGCFVLGGAVSAITCIAGHPILALPLGMIAGSLAGLTTAFLQTKLSISSIMAGISVNMALYSVNLFVMKNKSNVSLLKKETIFSIVKNTGYFSNYYEIVVGLFFVIVVVLFLMMFMKTNLGLSIKATGDNPTMVKVSSINPSKTITIGLMLSNSLTALSGALVAQYQSAIDINSSNGIVVTGLACLIIGETLLVKKSSNLSIIGAVIGSLIYRFIYALALYTEFLPVQWLKLLTALIVVFAIALPVIKEKYEFMKKKKEMGYVENK